MALDINQEEAFQKNDNALGRSGKSSDELKEKVKKLNEQFKDAAKTIKDEFSKSLVDAINGGDTFSKTFENVRKTLENLAIKTAVINPISDFLFGGDSGKLSDIDNVRDVLPAKGTSGVLGDLTNSIADLFGARAFGGPVGAGTPYLVGERGPELFVPQTAGRINPDMGGSALNIVMNITAQDAASFQASQTQIAASMMDAARRAQRIR